MSIAKSKNFLLHEEEYSIWELTINSQSCVSPPPFQKGLEACLWPNPLERNNQRDIRTLANLNSGHKFFVIRQGTLSTFGYELH